MYDAEMRNVMTMATVKAIAYEDQDRADGAALRRLREAFDGRAVITLSLLIGAIHDHSDDVFEVMVSRPTTAPVEDGLTTAGPVVRCMGNPIAEAADACRKALAGGAR